MKKYKILILSGCILLSFSCRKFVEIEAPKNQIVTGKVFSTNETANAAILDIYGLMYISGFASSYQIAHFTGICGDELTNYKLADEDLYVNAIDPMNVNHTNQLWKEAYKFIYYANAVFEGCKASGSLNPSVKKQLMAEALFIRAYWNFYLVNLYGDIPLVTTTDYTINSKLKRSASTDVYQSIITDLLGAQNDLNENYVSANSITTVTDRVRPNRAAATALLARVFLYTSKYEDAEIQSSQIINNNATYKLEPLSNVFLKESKEAVWQLSATTNNFYNTPEGFYFIPVNGAPATTGNPAMSSQILAAFEAGDNRRSVWVGSYNDTKVTPSKIYYYPYKYKVQSGSTLTEHCVLFRLAEQYLIRAEARNENGNLSGAIEDLNVLRARARATPNIDTPNPLPALHATLTKEDIRAAILKERQVELFTEQGHRWLDLKRTKTIDAAMTPATALKGGSWSNYKLLWPIPQTEILKNQKLIQNDAYK